MQNDSAAIAKSIATAEARLNNMSVLCGICSGRIEALRRDMRQIRSEVASAQKHQEQGRATASEVSPDMLGG